jgi:ubiquitin-protein ligase
MEEMNARRAKLLTHISFDLFLDAEYPVTPPKMSFVLNGNDSDAHSFNPNLHRGGGG